jgi:hypothetical protein
MVWRIESYRNFLLEVDHFWSGCVVIYCGWAAASPSDSAWAVPGTLDND